MVRTRILGFACPLSVSLVTPLHVTFLFPSPTYLRNTNDGVKISRSDISETADAAKNKGTQCLHPVHLVCSLVPGSISVH
jgi:hypothetical protein